MAETEERDGQPGGGGAEARPRRSGWRSHLESLALCSAGTLLFLIPGLDRSFSWLALVAITPWALLLGGAKRTHSVLWVLLGMTAAIPVINRYLFAFGAPIPYLNALVISPCLLPFPILTRLIDRWRRIPLALSVPVSWVAMELTLTHLSLGNTAVHRLGYYLAPYRFFNQTADLVGSYGASFMAAAVSGAVADVIRWQLERRPGGWRRLALPVAVGASVLVLSVGYSSWRIKRLKLSVGPTIALVQPNLPRTRGDVRVAMLRQSLLTLNHIEPGAAQLVVWPENSIQEFLGEGGNDYEEDLRYLSQRLQADFLVGAYGVPSDRPLKQTNSAFLMSRSGEITGRYDKNLLVPWGEYVPWKRTLTAIHPDLPLWHDLLTRRVCGYSPVGVPGAGAAVFESAGVKVAPIICFELTLPQYARGAALAGADVIVNITSEGRVAALQDLLLSVGVFRAIETRRTIVRDGNTGVSCLISPDGRVYSVLRGLETGKAIGESGVLVDELRLNQDSSQSFYTVHGDLFAWSNVALAILMAGLSLVSRRPRQGPPAE